MPRTKVTGLRSVAGGAVAADEETALPDKKQGLFQFRSRNAGYVLSLRRRRITRGPDGEAIEEAPRSKADSPLDWVRFEDHNFTTQDLELVELIKSKEQYGLPQDGGEFWLLDDERAARDVALEAELRQRLEDRPDIAKRVLKPSKSEDLSVPPVT